MTQVSRRCRHALETYFIVLKKILLSKVEYSENTEYWNLNCYSEFIQIQIQMFLCVALCRWFLVHHTLRSDIFSTHTIIYILLDNHNSNAMRHKMKCSLCSHWQTQQAETAARKQDADNCNQSSYFRQIITQRIKTNIVCLMIFILWWRSSHSRFFLGRPDRLTYCKSREYV